MRVWFGLVSKLSVFNAVRSFSISAEPCSTVGLVLLIVALKPDDLAVALKCEDMGRNSVEEPTIMAYHDGAACEV